MATKRDLVEAQAFNRRRLVTAFVSGAPGGREVEPARPGRIVVAGVALTVLLVAGAVIAGLFTTRTPDGWAQRGLFVSEERGVAYVITDDAEPTVLRPVVNITSAQLILGADVQPTIITQDAIDEVTVGDEIGILGAPATPPAADRLVETGWTACTNDGAGTKVSLDPSPEVEPAPRSGAVVRVGDAFYLLATAAQQTAEDPGAYAYRLPGEPSRRDNLLGDLGLRPSAFAAGVEESFLALLPTGGDLAEASLGLTGVGDPAPYADAASRLPSDARIGDVVRTRDDDRSYLLTQDGPAALDPFALAVLANLDVGRSLSIEGSLGLSQAKPTYLDARWPDGTLTPVLGQICAQLDAAAARDPRVALATGPGEAQSAAGEPDGSLSVGVATSGGAYVRAVSEASAGADSSVGSEDPGEDTAYLVDGTGRAFPLEGDAPALLGYADIDPPQVPASWLALFGPGTTLSQERALCPPTPDETATC